MLYVSIEGFMVNCFFRVFRELSAEKMAWLNWCSSISDKKKVFRVAQQQMSKSRPDGVGTS